MCSLWECFGYSKEKRKNTGTYFKTTKNRSQQTSSYEGYLYNDCHESLSKKIFEGAIAELPAQPFTCFKMEVITLHFLGKKDIRD